MVERIEGREAPPWLKRHMDALAAMDVVRMFKETPIERPEDVIKHVGERYRKIKPPRHPNRLRRRILLEYKRLELVYNIVTAKLSQIARLPATSRMDPFHRALVKMFIGEHYDEALKAVRRALRLAKEFWTEYRLLILSSRAVDEAKRFRKEGSGRILSLIRRLRKHIEVLRKVREEILKTHIVSEGLPVVAVAGIPSAGKSTLVRRLSTAKPEVADYPFTTKTIIVGKAACKNLTFYLVDTPGLLERPLEELNEIERKALAALMTLPDVIIFMFDVSKDSYVNIDRQLELYKSISKMAREKGTDVIVVANKIDAADANALNRLNSMIGASFHTISALRGDGVDELLNDLCKRLQKASNMITS